MTSLGIKWRTGLAVATVGAAVGASISLGVKADTEATSGPGSGIVHVHLLPYVGPLIPSTSPTALVLPTKSHGS